MARASAKIAVKKTPAKSKAAAKAAPAKSATERDLVRVKAGEFTFLARLELEAAPKTCKAFIKALPFESSFVHVRWSGEGVWVPLGERDFGVGYENHTSFPAPGHMLLYPTGISETELIMAYGGVRFACKMGQLAGNHFLTIVEGNENLPALGKACLWKGAQKLTIDWA
jgi:Protein of unknown function (DUF3830)